MGRDRCSRDPAVAWLPPRVAGPRHIDGSGAHRAAGASRSGVRRGVGPSSGNRTVRVDHPAADLCHRRAVAHHGGRTRLGAHSVDRGIGDSGRGDRPPARRRRRRDVGGHGRRGVCGDGPVEVRVRGRPAVGTRPLRVSPRHRHHHHRQPGTQAVRVLGAWRIDRRPAARLLARAARRQVQWRRIRGRRDMSRHHPGSACCVEAAARHPHRRRRRHRRSARVPARPARCRTRRRPSPRIPPTSVATRRLERRQGIL